MRDNLTTHAPSSARGAARRLGYAFALALTAVLALAACTGSGGASGDPGDALTTPAPLETGPMTTDTTGY